MKALHIILAFVLSTFYYTSVFATSYTWNGTTSTDWGTSTNWTPNGTPGSGDNVTIVTTANDPVYDGSSGVTDITMTSGTLDLNGYTLTFSGTGTFNGGTVTNGTISCSSATDATFAGTVMDCKVNVTASDVYLDGSLFKDTLIAEKTGSSNNSGNGGNDFEDYASLTASGTGSFRTGTLYPDTFRGELDLISEDGFVIIANDCAGTQFQDDVEATCSTGSGVYIGQSTSSGSTLVSGKVIDVDNVSTGVCRIWGVTQSSATAQSFTPTSSALLYIYYCDLAGTITATAPRLFLRENIFDGNVSFTKNGSSTDAMNGGNIYNGTSSFTNSGSGEIRMQTVLPDTFNMKASFTTSSDDIRLAYADVSDVTLFADTVEFTSNSSGTNDFSRDGDMKFEDIIILARTAGNIQFGVNGGTSTLADDGKFRIGSSGFNGGTLRLVNIDQTGSSNHVLELTSSAILLIDTASFNGVVNFSAPSIRFANSSFNQITNLTKTGSGTSQCDGGNSFSELTTIINEGTGDLTMAYTKGDTFNADVIFTQESTGDIFPAYNDTTFFSGHLRSIGSSLLDIGAGSSPTPYIVFDGDEMQYIDGPSSEIRFSELYIDKSAGNLISYIPITITDTLHFEDGLLFCDTNTLTFNDNSSYTGINDTSYIDGRVKKIGDDAFTFPIGTQGHQRPFTITASGSATDAYSILYYNEHPDSSGYDVTSKDGSLNEISENEFWNFTRDAGTNDVNVTLSWDKMSCGFDTLNNLRIAAWNGSQWKDQGNGGTSGDTTSGGTIIATSAPGIYGPYTLATVDTFRCVSCVADAGTNTWVFEGNSRQLGIETVAGYTYLWTPDTELDDDEIAMPTASPTSSLIYTLEITNTWSCKAVDEVSLTVVEIPKPAPDGFAQ